MSKKYMGIIGAILIFLVIWSTGCTARGQVHSPKDELVLTVIDVGQGDSSLIELPSGETLLIDAGSKGDFHKIDTVLREKKIKRLDHVILTHPHEDHIGGATELVKAYMIGKFYMPDVVTSTKTFEMLLNTVKSRSVKGLIPRVGSYLIDEEDVKVQVIAPNGKEYDEINEYSIVVRVTYKEKSFLFMGDAESISENEILKEGYEIRSDVIKIGHHGGKTSTKTAFLKAVAPKIAIITVGSDNDYGHPHKETIKRLSKIKDIDIIRTDRSGTITIISDGINIQTDTER